MRAPRVLSRPYCSCVTRYCEWGGLDETCASQTDVPIPATIRKIATGRMSLRKLRKSFLTEAIVLFRRKDALVHQNELKIELVREKIRLVFPEILSRIGLVIGSPLLSLALNGIAGKDFSKAAPADLTI